MAKFNKSASIPEMSYLLICAGGTVEWMYSIFIAIKTKRFVIYASEAKQINEVSIKRRRETLLLN